MRYTLILAGILGAWSCSCSSRKAIELEGHFEREVHSQTTELVAKKAVALHLDISLLKECGERGISSFNMDSLSDPGKYLENSLIDEVFGKIPVNGHTEWKLESNADERFSCHQWEEDESFFYFTLLQQDESCCLTMFLCVTDKKGKLLAISQLGVAGRDGGWSGNDRGEKIQHGKFKVFNKSTYDSDSNEKGGSKGFIRKFEATQILIEWDNTKTRFKVDTLNYSTTDTLISYKKSY